MKLDQLKLNVDDIPFKKSLSFLPLINKLKQEQKEGVEIDLYSKIILDLVEKNPELAKTDFNIKDVEKYEKEIHTMMSYIFTPAQYKKDIGVVASPFDDKNFYFTPNYLEIYNNENIEIEFVEQRKQDSCYMTFTKLIYAYLMILPKFYNFQLDMDYLFLYRMTDKLNGLVKYYKLEFNESCIELSHKGALPIVSEDQIREMINDPMNMDFWLQTLPLDNFTFSGFMSFRYVDVTQIEVISSLKSQLLEKSSIINRNNFSALEQNIRSLLALPNLNLGVISMGVSQGHVDNPSNFWHGFIDSKKYQCDAYRGTIYEEAALVGSSVLVGDLSKRESLQPVEQELLNQGIKNISITPLHYDGELVGMLELGSTKAFDINFTKLRVIKDIIPIFSIAVQRTSEELKNRIEATIKEECTAIHPSVEWRFQEAAGRLLENKESDELAKMEEIVFKEVHPLYGAIDVRHSSVIRNQTIQDDLVEQLLLARMVLKEAFSDRKMPIYDQLIYKIDFFIEGIQKGLSSGDEINVLSFIRNDVESLFPHFNEKGPALTAAIAEYDKNIDPELNIVYKRRKDFEDSLGMINDCVTSYLEKEEEKAQKMFPHYFEKYRTDGVEHNIYIGQSIAANKTFDRIYLKNLRLWQLIVSVELARKTNALRSSLPIDLETTGLILVHSQPLAIRFRQDEKKFDVDGAYNIRYEIVKKRIDKAVIKGTSERLTQPGKLAVIFSQEAEMAEYQRYLEYLIAKGYFEDNIEHVVLEDLQGVYGLRAIRVQIKDGKVREEVLEVAKKLKLNE
ncbi:hypothetical protein BZG02_14670 [Labilibaculum filiforme]|uniref:GAF domain-containing protein n=1 Tax=Labilibaculum filiforme TaxID=1940526 RepID=A0A2N3HUW6_9BACT|nr:GAF domain-containing protein [Labilibaculum filiforme]PKQ61866.1 hypothetical protein BZG02_14670 [Labilibaculum filiforme]